MKKTQVVSVGIAFVLAITLTLHAQTAFSVRTVSTPTAVQSVSEDSVLAVVAEAQGLQLVPPEEVPPYGTFWTVLPGSGGGITAPFPCPPLDPSLPIYAIADGQFLVVDGTTNVGGASAAVLAEQANAVVNLITQVQTVAANRQVRTMARAMGMDVQTPDAGSNYPSSYAAYAFDTNQLWLEITGVSNDAAWFNLHNATNQVYAIWSTTNLLAEWNVETELWPGPDQTSVLPFTVANLNRQNLFVRAEDWTGVDSDGDGIPDWWIWFYFGDQIGRAHV